MRRATESVGDINVSDQSKRSVQQRPESMTRFVDSGGRKLTIPVHDLWSTCAMTAAMKDPETKTGREGDGEAEQQTGRRSKEDTNKHNRHCHAR